MSYYSPIDPTPKKPDDLPVGRIIAIVVLFSIGLWPIAVYLIWKTFSESKRPPRGIPPGRAKQQRNGKIYGDFVPYEPATPPKGVPPIPQYQKAAPPPAAQQPPPRSPVEEKPATQSSANVNGVKKPWWHTALGALGIGLIAAGSLFSFLGLGNIFGGGTLSEAITMFTLSASFVVSVGCLLLVPRSLALQEAKKIRFCNVVGTRKVMRLADMAATLGIPFSQLVKELQRHLDKGLFPGGYIDHARKLLVVSAEGVDFTALEDELSMDKSNNGDTQPASRRDMLAKIRMVNKRIADESVSKNVQRIEEITALIL